MEEIKITKREIGILLVLMIAVVLIRGAYLHMPFTPDELSRANIAMSLDKGKLPYQDLYDTSMPFIYYIYATAFKTIGISVEGVRIFTLAYVIFTMLALYIFIRFYQGWVTSLIVVFFYILFQSNLRMNGFLSGSEIFVQLPLIIGMMFLTDRDIEYEKTNSMIAGVFFSIAFCVNSMVGFVVLVPVIMIIFSKRTKTIKLSNYYRYMSGFFILFISALMWYQKNGLTDFFWEYNVIHGLREILQRDSGVSAMNLKAFIATGFVPIAAFVWAAYKMFKKAGDEIAVPFYITIAIFVAIALMGAPKSDHFIILVPFFAILSALMFREIFKALSSFNKIAAYIIVTIVLIATTVVYLFNCRIL